MTRRRALVLAGSGLGGLLALALLLLAVLWGMQAGTVLPNTSIAGVDVSGLTADEAADALEPLVTERREDPVAFTFEDERFEVLPAEVGYRVDLDATVGAAMSRGRTSPIADIGERLRSFNESATYDLVDTYDEDAIRDWVASVADDVDREVFAGEVTIDPDSLEVSQQLPHGSATVRQDDTVEQLIAALHEEGSEELELPVDTEPQRVPDNDVRSVAAQVERALAGPLELTANDEELVLEPTDLATVIDVQERETGSDSATLELVVTPDRLMGVVDDEDVERFARDPIDARYVASRNPPRRFDAQGSASFSPVPANVEVEEGRHGTRFDPELAADQITQLLRDGARGGELKLERIEADFPTQLAQQLKPTHLLGTFTTYHAAGANRVHNIQLLADTINGAVVMPDEQFSINEISGPRSCDRGYREDGMILRGELVDVCGGGTSQFGTTTLNAAFFAGVQLDAWKAHSWYISRYPMGREATLNYPVLDVKFTNNTEGALIVTTTHTPTSITVSIYGQPIAQTVTATHGNPSNWRDYDEEERETNELYEDQRRVLQSGTRGFQVTVTRTIDKVDGGNNTETIRTTYSPQRRIVEVGTRPRPNDDDNDNGDDGDDGDGDDEDD